MSDYILSGAFIILSILFGIHMLMVREISISHDAYVAALKDYIKALERHIEILREGDGEGGEP